MSRMRRRRFGTATTSHSWTRIAAPRISGADLASKASPTVARTSGIVVTSNLRGQRSAAGKDVHELVLAAEHRGSLLLLGPRREVEALATARSVLEMSSGLRIGSG